MNRHQPRQTLVRSMILRTSYCLPTPIPLLHHPAANNVEPKRTRTIEPAEQEIHPKLDRDISPTRCQDRRSTCWLRLILCAADSLRHCGLTTGRTEGESADYFVLDILATRPFISNHLLCNRGQRFSKRAKSNRPGDRLVKCDFAQHPQSSSSDAKPYPLRIPL